MTKSKPTDTNSSSGNEKLCPPKVTFHMHLDADRDGETNGRHRIEFSPTGEVVGHMIQLIGLNLPENRLIN